MKLGTIILWYGAIVDIPYGWHLCDGSHSTPNLIAKFIIGAGDTYNPNDTGGAGSHNHDFTASSHYHDLLVAGANIGWDGPKYRRLGGKAAVGTTGTTPQIPPRKNLCYIMKLVPSRHNG